MRIARYCHSIIACVCLVSSAAFAAAATALERFVDFVLNAISPAPALVLDTGSECWGGTRLTFDDPKVDRHEAGTSRRAAARHI